MSIIIRWLVMTVAVWVAAAIVPGIHCDDWQSLIIAALALGILNALVKPLLQLVSMPLIILTLGLFVLVINAGLLAFTAWLVSGFHVSGFWPAVGGSLVISIVSMFMGRPRIQRRVSVSDNDVDQSPSVRRGPPPGSGKIIDV